MKRCYGILCIIVFFVFLGGYPAQAQEEKADDDLTCQTLMLKKCDDCHYMTRVCYEVGKKSKRKWKRIIKKMVRRGMKVSQNEKDALLVCLGEKVEEAQEICNEYLKP